MGKSIQERIEETWIGRAAAQGYAPGSKQYAEAEVNFFAGAAMALHVTDPDASDTDELSKRVPVAWILGPLTGRGIVNTEKRKWPESCGECRLCDDYATRGYRRNIVSDQCGEWVCNCGNRADTGGFHPVDKNLNPCEPDEAWGDDCLLECDGCGAIISSYEEASGNIIKTGQERGARV